MVATRKHEADTSGAPTETGTPDTRPTADVVWPDPSPLQDWWTAVMDGAASTHEHCADPERDVGRAG